MTNRKNKLIKIVKLVFLITMIITCFASSTYANPTSERNNKEVDSVVLKTNMFNPDTATQEYLSKLTPEQKSKSDAYFEGGYWLLFWNMVYDVLIAWIFLSLGLSRWIKKLALKTKNINIQNLIYVGCYTLLVFLMILPFDIYANFFREHQYGLSNLTFGNWFTEKMVSFCIKLIIESIIIMLLYVALRKVKQNWWIWGGIISIVFMTGIILIAPIFIGPLFNKYTPLPENKLKEEILSIARANGVPTNQIYQYDNSKQTNAISANVSGLGSTTRISLNDNLLNTCTPAEIKSVVAHEMGHYLLNHGYKMIVFFGMIILFGLVLINWSFKKIINLRGCKWQIADISDISGLPLLMILFSLYMFMLTPIRNDIMLQKEVEADLFALNAAREPDGFAAAVMKTSDYRKVDPGYWEEIIFYDHPSIKSRISSAMRWKAENLDDEAK